MKRVFIDYHNHLLSGLKNAGGKAQQDCGRILHEYGFVGLHMFMSRQKKLRTLISMLRIMKKIPHEGIVIIQYPLGKSQWLNNVIMNTCKRKKCRTILLIHDINSLRTQGVVSTAETKTFEKADVIIAHNEAMINLLKKTITHVEYYNLEAFDYFYEVPATPHTFDNTVVFAGNLHKSQFLYSLRSVKVNFILYGIEVEGLKQICNENVKYVGAFTQDNLSILSGDWGLVWDGKSVSTCDGSLGNYMRYNAPHKLSLYLVAGLPVIIWENAAEARLVEKYNLGITIASLDEIKEKIEKISPEEYGKIKNNVAKYAKRLSSGGNLKAVLERMGIRK